MSRGHIFKEYYYEPFKTGEIWHYVSCNNISYGFSEILSTLPLFRGLGGPFTSTTALICSRHDS